MDGWKKLQVHTPVSVPLAPQLFFDLEVIYLEACQKFCGKADTKYHPAFSQELRGTLAIKCCNHYALPVMSLYVTLSSAVQSRQTQRRW